MADGLGASPCACLHHRCQSWRMTGGGRGAHTLSGPRKPGPPLPALVNWKPQRVLLELVTNGTLPPQHVDMVISCLDNLDSLLTAPRPPEPSSWDPWCLASQVLRFSSSQTGRPFTQGPRGLQPPPQLQCRGSLARCARRLLGTGEADYEKPSDSDHSLVYNEEKSPEMILPAAPASPKPL